MNEAEMLASAIKYAAGVVVAVQIALTAFSLGRRALRAV